MKNILLKIIRFPFDFLAIIYLNIIESRNTEYYFDFDDYYEEIERKYKIWVEKFDYRIAILFWILMIVYFCFIDKL